MKRPGARPLIADRFERDDRRWHPRRILREPKNRLRDSMIEIIGMFRAQDRA